MEFSIPQMEGIYSVSQKLSSQEGIWSMSQLDGWLVVLLVGRVAS
jgi:hypothetical protein